MTDPKFEALLKGLFAKNENGDVFIRVAQIDNTEGTEMENAVNSKSAISFEQLLKKAIVLDEFGGPAIRLALVTGGVTPYEAEKLRNEEMREAAEERAQERAQERAEADAIFAHAPLTLTAEPQGIPTKYEEEEGVFTAQVITLVAVKYRKDTGEDAEMHLLGSPITAPFTGTTQQKEAFRTNALEILRQKFGAIAKSPLPLSLSLTWGVPDIDGEEVAELSGTIGNVRYEGAEVQPVITLIFEGSLSGAGYEVTFEI